MLDTVLISGYTVLDFVIIGALGIGGYLVYAFLGDSEKQESFNAFIGAVIDKAGMGKDKLLDEDEMRDKLESAVQYQKENASEQEVEVTVDQVMREISAIQSQSKHLGKEEEQMKGEDSDDLYNISIITMLGVVSLVLLQIYVHFV